MQFNQVKKYDLNQNTNPGGLNSLYVDGSNAQGGDGSVTNPFKTLDSVINYLSTNALTGYTIKIAGGAYTTALSFDGKNSLYCEPGTVITYTGASYLFNCVNNVASFYVYGFGTFKTSTGGIVFSSNSNVVMIASGIRSDTPAAAAIPCVALDTTIAGYHNLYLDLQGGNFLSAENHGIKAVSGARVSVINTSFNVGYNAGVSGVRVLFAQNLGLNASTFSNCNLQTSVNNSAVVEFNGPQAYFKFNHCTFDLSSGNTVTSAILFSKNAGVNCSFSQSFKIQDTIVEPSSGTYTYSMSSQNLINIEVISLLTGLSPDPAFAITNIFPEYRLFKSTLLASPVDGTLEFDGTDYYVTTGTVRERLVKESLAIAYAIALGG